MEHTPSSPGKMEADPRSLYKSHKSDMMEWVDWKENSEEDLVRVPPVSIIVFRDLLERAWGWDRLLPQVHGSVPWHEFKLYLEEYWKANTDKVFAGNKGALHFTAKLCIDTENKIIRSCVRHFSFEDMTLSSQIKKRARDLLQSDCEYPAAAAALVSIIKEAELMYQCYSRGYGISESIALGRKVRCFASNLILYKGSDFGAAAGAMVGVATEAQMILDSIHENSRSLCMDYFACNEMRHFIVSDLTKLEQELACNVGSDATEKPIGFSTGGGLDSEGSVQPDGFMGNSENKMDQNLNNQTYSAEGNRKVNDVEDLFKDFKNDTKGEAFAKDAGEVLKDFENDTKGEALAKDAGEVLKDFENDTKGEALATCEESVKAFADTSAT